MGPPHGELAGGLENLLQGGGQIHYGKLSQEVSFLCKMWICGLGRILGRIWGGFWDGKIHYGKLSQEVSFLSKMWICGLGRILGRIWEILGWKSPLRKVVPGGEFLVQNVDLWATPHWELAGGGEELVPGLELSVRWGRKVWNGMNEACQRR